MKNTKMVLMAIGCLVASSSVLADSTRIVLKKAPDFGEEGIFLKTDKGSFAWNMYVMKEPVLNVLSKAKKGQCLILKSKGKLNDEADIQSVSVCPRS